MLLKDILFEWRDRSRMESRNAETHLWRKNVYDLNMHGDGARTVAVHAHRVGVHRNRRTVDRLDLAAGRHAGDSCVQGCIGQQVVGGEHGGGVKS